MPQFSEYVVLSSVRTYIFDNAKTSPKKSYGKEINSSALFASVYIDILYASLALDEATPVKLAFASFPDGRFLRVVSSAAAKEITTVHAGRGPIA